MIYLYAPHVSYRDKFNVAVVEALRCADREWTMRVDCKCHTLDTSVLGRLSPEDIVVVISIAPEDTTEVYLLEGAILLGLRTVTNLGHLLPPEKRRVVAEVLTIRAAAEHAVYLLSQR
jgi:hypothetical protein